VSEHVLVVNAGSSSIKYQLIDVEAEEALAVGLLERIGQPMGAVRHDGTDGRTSFEAELPDHEAGVRMLLRNFAEHGPTLDTWNLVAVGHRVVQGGDRFSGPAVVDEKVEADIEDLCTLGPLHNPAHLAGIRAARKAFPDVPHVVVFDTSFHTTLPPEAYTYAIDRELARAHAIRRYGAHGTSHKYVSERTAALLGKDPSEVNVIVAHLGNGASITAVRGGRSVETSMGLTPLEGVLMGTRSGDVDPAIVEYIADSEHMTVGEVVNFLNKKSGLLGLSGVSSDMRDVWAAANAGNEMAKITIDIWAYRIRKYIGAYAAAMGGLDAIVFTAGIGENDAGARALILEGLEFMGVKLDPEVNDATRAVECQISTADSKVRVWVIPTNEEIAIARDTLELIKK